MPNPPGYSWTETAVAASRVLLGAAFLYLGILKASDPVAFLKMVREYQMIELPLLLNSVAALLPWIEILCGLLLLAGIGIRGNALILGAMLALFTCAILLRGWNYASTTGIAYCAIRFDCGCGTGEVAVCNKAVQNAGLLLLALVSFFGPADRFALRPELVKRPGNV